MVQRRDKEEPADPPARQYHCAERRDCKARWLLSTRQCKMGQLEDRDSAKISTLEKRYNASAADGSAEGVRCAERRDCNAWLCVKEERRRRLKERRRWRSASLSRCRRVPSLAFTSLSPMLKIIVYQNLMIEEVYDSVC